MKKSICSIAALTIISVFIRSAGAQETMFNHLTSGVLFWSVGFFALSSVYAKDMDDSSKNLNRAVVLLSFGLGTSSFYKAATIKEDKGKYENLDDRLVGGYKIQGIIYGSLFIYMGLNAGTADELSDEGRRYYDIGKAGIVAVGLISLAKPFIVYRSRKEEPETESKSGGRGKFALIPYVGGNEAGVALLKRL